MSRIRILFAMSLAIAIGAIVPTAQAAAAPVAKAIIAGSSAIWQSAALGAYNFKAGETYTGGSCVAGLTPPCFHYTSSNGFQVNDTRPTKKGGTTAVDVNSIWIVWDSHSTTAGASPNFFAYIKVDSVVGDRCYYGQPRCNVNTGGAAFPAAANAIKVWPDGSTDSTPPTAIQNLFTATTGPLVSAAATDVRAEDGLFAMCRANSAQPATLDNQMKGLGYNANNASGVCAPASGGTLAELDGSDVQDTQGSTAHVLAFAISGSDPFSGTKIVAGTTVPAGAAPIVFITHVLASGNPLDGVTGVTDQQLQSLFKNTGAGCDGTTLGGNAGDIDAWLREPLSGTYNTTEYNVFSYPDFSGTSQEAYLNPTSSGGNPLSQTCPAGGGNRIRGIGTSHVINTGTVTDTTHDSIAYTFFSYGNVKPASDTSCTPGICHYLKLNGIDPIFHHYVSTAGATALDPGQPNTNYGQVPSAADTPCASFPCLESKIWKGGLSFPNLRSGQYSAWSILRMISDTTALGNVKNLIAASQIYAATSTPDFVPAVLVAANATLSFDGDPGIQLLRSHYQQVDNAGTLIGPAPVDDSTTGDAGGDVAGCIEHFLPGVTADDVEESDAVTTLIHTAVGNECSTAPTSH
jgi:hypothetical protein